VTEDWLDVLVALLEAGARFLVVGAHALAVHGVPRATQDLDIWVEPAPENADRVWDALIHFGAPLDDLGVDRNDFIRPATVVQLGLPPNRIDILTGITGITDFEEAWVARTEREIGNHMIPFIGCETLIANKRAAGRLKDLADIEALGGDV
jgi:hypothetical protein